MDADAVRRIHDAAIELGAHCDSNCYWNPSQYKSYKHTLDRARALMFLSSAARN